MPNEACLLIIGQPDHDMVCPRARPINRPRINMRQHTPSSLVMPVFTTGLSLKKERISEE